LVQQRLTPLQLKVEGARCPMLIPLLMNVNGYLDPKTKKGFKGKYQGVERSWCKVFKGSAKINKTKLCSGQLRNNLNNSINNLSAHNR